MYFVDIFTSANVILAIAVYGVLAAIEPFLAAWLQRVFAHDPPFDWTWDYFVSPLFRAALVLGFVCLAYPGLFGLREAPSVLALMANHEAQPSTLLGIIFIIALLAPLVPVFNRHAEFVLPLQGIFASAFLFKWLAGYLNVTVASVWPGLDIILVLLGTSYLAHRAARDLGLSIGGALDRRFATSGYDLVVMHVVTMLAQIPVIVIYGCGLGRQIAI